MSESFRVFSKTAEVKKLKNNESFRPNVFFENGQQKVFFGNGYIIEPFNLSTTPSLFETEFSSKITEIDNIEDSFEITTEDKEFFLYLKIDPIGNEILSAQIKKKTEVDLITSTQGNEEVPTRNIFLPVAKFKQSYTTGDFYLDKWVLKNNIYWEKKRVSAPFKIEYAGSSGSGVNSFLLSYGEVEILGVDYPINEDRKSFYINASANDVIGLIVRATISDSIFSISNVSIDVTSEIPGAIQDVNYTYNSADPSPYPQSSIVKFVPLAYIGLDGKTVSQSAYGPFTVSYETVSRSGNLTTKNLRFVGNL